MKELNGKTVLITGAASGIGRQLAHAFAAEGSRVVAVDINEEGCRATAAELTGACSYALDVTDAAAAVELAKTVEREVGPLDILVNCAGIVFLSEIADTSLEEWHRIIDINLMGPIHLISAFLPGMYERRSGHVVNISSGAGLFPPAHSGRLHHYQVRACRPGRDSLHGSPRPRGGRDHHLPLGGIHPHRPERPGIRLQTIQE